MANLMPPLGSPHSLFGVSATVTPLGGSPIVTTAIKLRGAAPPAVGSLGMSASAAVDLRPVISIPRSAIASRPAPGSTVAADFGDGLRTYRVDRIDDDFPDEWRVVVS